MLSASSGTGVLAAYTDTPPVTETTMGPDLLHALDVITKLGIEVLGEDLAVLSGLEILLPVKEPEWDLKLAGVLDDGDQLFDLIGRELSSTLVHVDLGLFADEISKPASETLDFGEAENDVPLALNIGVENTQDVLKLRTLH